MLVVLAVVGGQAEGFEDADSLSGVNDESVDGPPGPVDRIRGERGDSVESV
ncbi:hypothetical protein [Frankia sp. KB5]|uniref:hypothetical protein n=1 Tax=Frankia sp. KB5 TaxID=683318 RepID=UPI0012FF70A3|nr:hypothetical protein [Frankia sp. KB5]